jgi:CheY-like chemotaxis protein
MSASFLILYAPSGSSHPISLAGADTWTIGRGRGNAIVLADQWVSREHALLRCTESGECYLIDLGSQNGSFVNARPVQVPVLLSPGDRLTFGKTEIEFQQSLPEVEEIATFDPELQPKTVVVAPAASQQGLLWQALLRSQNLSVNLAAPTKPLHHLLDQLSASQQRLPDLLVVDLTTQKPSPYEFCRWCRQHYPTVKIILTSGSCQGVSPVEQRWATQQGAVDLLPAFPTKNLAHQALPIAASLNKVLSALELPLVEAVSLVGMLWRLEQPATAVQQLTAPGDLISLSSLSVELDQPL